MRRAAARNGLGQHQAAARDLSVVLVLEPAHREAAAELRKTQEAVKACNKRLPTLDITPTARSAGWVDLPVGDAVSEAAFGGATIISVPPPPQPPLPSNGGSAAARGAPSAGVDGDGDGVTAVNQRRGSITLTAIREGAEEDVDEGGGGDAAEEGRVARLAASVTAKVATAGAPRGSESVAGGSVSGAERGPSPIKPAAATPPPALQPIRTGYEFERAWRVASRAAGAGDGAAQRELVLERVPPTAWSTLFPLALDPDVWSGMALCVIAADADGDARVPSCLAGMLAMRGLPVTMAMCEAGVVAQLAAVASKHGLSDAWRRVVS